MDVMNGTDSRVAELTTSLAAARERSPSPALSSIDSIDDPLADLGPEPVVPAAGFHNDIEAEKAFIYLLKKFRVDETWTWDVTMRKIIVDPLYKSLKTLAEKKNVWQKVCTDLDAPSIPH